MYMHPYIYSSEFTIAKIWKQSKFPSVDEWIKKAVEYLHNGILRSSKKRRNSCFATAWMDLEKIMLSELSQLVKEKYHVISCVCGI